MPAVNSQTEGIWLGSKYICVYVFVVYIYIIYTYTNSAGTSTLRKVPEEIFWAGTERSFECRLIYWLGFVRRNGEWLLSGVRI